MWRAAGLSVRGAAHDADGTGCQDAFAVHAADEFVVAAVSDGLSSSARSGEGARWAVDAAVDSARRCLESADAVSASASCGTIAITALLDSRAFVLEKARLAGGEPAEFASTLLVAVATVRGFGYAQVGDGAIVVLAGDGSYRTLPRTESDFVNITVALTSRTCEGKVSFGDLEDRPRFAALFTDGLEPAVLRRSSGADAPVPFERFFSGIRSNFRKCRDEQEVAAFEVAYKAWLEEKEFREKYTDDDVTLVVLANIVDDTSVEEAGGRG